MQDIARMLIDHLGSDRLGALAGAVGADTDAARRGVDAAVPLLLGGLARNAADRDGAAALERALDRDHDGSILDRLGDSLGDAATRTAGEGILRHVLGDGVGDAARSVGDAAGLAPDQAQGLLALVAPMVMGLLGKARRAGGLDAASLLAMVTGQGGGGSPLDLLGGILGGGGASGAGGDALGGLARGLGRKLFGG